MTDCKRLPDENIKEYKIRLCLNKDLYGLTYTDIAELINLETGDTKGESAYRKWWAAYKEGYDDAERQAMSANDVIQQYDDVRIAAEKARMRFFDQRTAYNKEVRNGARFDELKDIIESKLDNIEPYEFNRTITPASNNDLLVGLNDLHYGANIKNAWNVYNSDIAKERLEKYLNSILDIQKTHHSENCIVMMGGDNISGNIHLTLQIANKENVVQQIMGVSELVAWFLSKLCNYFNLVTVVSVPGNHSRLSLKENSPKDERLDDLLPWYIKARLSNLTNLKFVDNTIDNTVSLVNIRGLNYLNVHGDFDKFNNCQKVIDMIEEPIYCVHLGHLHHNKVDWVHKYKVIMSGSLQGMDDYCVEKRIYGKAQQLVSVCTDKGIVCSYDVLLQD